MSLNILINNFNMEKQLGGNRLGSGSKTRDMSVFLSNYERSTFNQSRRWMSTMACGTLVPFFHEVGTNGDKFDIDLSLMCRTLPTIGPLFGSFKVQLDMFACPIRLYNGLLHNNAVKIGLNMDKVLFPTLTMSYNDFFERYKDQFYFAHPSSLMAYLGQRSAPCSTLNANHTRKYNALAIHAYYDIYKNYYANKQENTAYIIGVPSHNAASFTIDSYNISITKNSIAPTVTDFITKPLGITSFPDLKFVSGDKFTMRVDLFADDIVNIIDGVGDNKLSTDNLYRLFESFTCDGVEFLNFCRIDNISIHRNDIVYTTPIGFNDSMGPLQWSRDFDYKRKLEELREQLTDFSYYMNITFTCYKPFNTSNLGGKLTFDTNRRFGIVGFPLQNIDEMRVQILQNTGLGKVVDIDKNSLLPYSALAQSFDKNTEVIDKQFLNGQPYSALPMYGLALKTYQSDINNNWLNASDVLQYVTSASEVKVIDGSFDIDALIMAKKVYNLLNRIVVSGSTWTDWQEAVYSEDAVTRAEQPIYVGGMSADVIFDEVVSTSAESLGQLAGKGNITNVDGGHIVVNCNEPMLILGIASITPRVAYSQSNWWFNQLSNLDELHKPAFDGISFQDKLIHDFVPYSDYYDDQNVLHQKAIGKQPAWLHYMTAYDEIFGSFAIDTELNYMTLDRRYQVNIDTSNKQVNVVDATTYIDPSRYLYAFQGQRLEDAQVFWLQVGVDCQSRRKMSARQMPQL